MHIVRHYEKYRIVATYVHKIVNLAISVNGGWSAFGPWNVCSKTCDGGQQTRTRSCSNPPPWNGGTQCVGTSQETKSCSLEKCQGIYAVFAVSNSPLTETFTQCLSNTFQRTDQRAFVNCGSLLISLVG